MNETTAGGFSLSGFLGGVGKLADTAVGVIGAVKGTSEKTNAASADEIERLLAQQEVARQEAAAKAKTNWKLFAGIGVGVLAVFGLVVWAFKR